MDVPCAMSFFTVCLPCGRLLCPVCLGDLAPHRPDNTGKPPGSQLRTLSPIRQSCAGEISSSTSRHRLLSDRNMTLGQVVPRSAVIMLLSRVQVLALQRGTVYDLLVGRHLLTDIQLGVRKNAVFGGNVLNAVVHLLEIAAAGQIARGAK